MCDRQGRTWEDRLSFLTDDELRQVTKSIRMAIAGFLRDRHSFHANHRANDNEALAMWRERHAGDSRRRKAKAIRNTEEYRAMIADLEERDRAANPIDTERRDMEHAILEQADGIDAVIATLQALDVPQGGLRDTGISDALTDALLGHAGDILDDAAIDRLFSECADEIAKVLSSGDLEDYACEDGYDQPYWHMGNHRNIMDVDDLLELVSRPDWEDELAGSDFLPPVLYRIMWDDSLWEGDMTTKASDALLASEEGTALSDLSELVIPEWDNADALIDWRIGMRDGMFSGVGRLLPDERVTGLVRQNPRYSKMLEEHDRRLEQERRIAESIVERIPSSPIDLYPLARSMSRHFTLHVGPTNSGKTHDAIDALGKAPSGAYLAPLRLLAYEQYERLNDNGCPCSLLTGEEEVTVAGASHVASTIEMLDYSTPIDVAVIDEAQMLADRDRGSHWTEAILGVPAREVHVCLAPEAEDIVKALVAACGDACDVVRHERMSPLEWERGPFSFPKDVRKGDALVVFTRRAVHAVAAEVSRSGLRTSMVYGALPYDVRHREAERFASGETDVVVATDAIGMGMNLPIQRVVFLEQAKFDGREKRFLTGGEIRQIAGRAGRYGMHEKGLWKSANEGRKMGRLAKAEPRQIPVAPIGFVRTLLGVEGRVSQLIGQWVALDMEEPFRKTELERELALVTMLEARVTPEEAEDLRVKRLIYDFATMPFKENIDMLSHLWLRMFDSEMEGEPFPVRVPSGPLPHDMEGLEEEYAHADLLHQYCRMFGHTEHYEAIARRRAEISDRTSEMISKSVFSQRRCRECGKPMPWNWPYPMCDPCHERLYPNRCWYGDW